jgi:hypothetical protein
MKVSELVIALQHFSEQYGDVPVCVSDDGLLRDAKLDDCLQIASGLDAKYASVSAGEWIVTL